MSAHAFVTAVLLSALFASPVVPPVAAQHPGHPQPAPAATPPEPQPPAQPADEDAAHAPTASEQKADLPKEPIPPVSEADRAAAFPPALDGHAVHDRRITTFVLVDQLEWQAAGAGAALDGQSWVGGDINRFWVRAEGEMDSGRVDSAFVHALWGHSFSSWWDVVAGIRQDFRPGNPQTWAAVGVQGLAPQWFEVQATGYIGADARTHARFEVEYDLLLTNRLVLQPVVELEMYGKPDPERGIGAGLSSLETGVRLRYEIRREFAPYVGVVWDRKLFGTADFASADGEDVSSVKLALGLRTWF